MQKNQQAKEAKQEQEQEEMEIIEKGFKQGQLSDNNEIKQQQQHVESLSSSCIEKKEDDDENDNDHDDNDKNKKNVVPRNNREYITKEYWNQRFLQEDEFDWLVSYEQIRDQLQSIILSASSAKKKRDEYNILIVGCGNSNFSEKLYDDGYINITNVDYSNIVIHHMKEKHQFIRPDMKWMIMDITQMKNEIDNNDNDDNNMLSSSLYNTYYDIIIDKAVMDTILTNEDVWDPNTSSIQLAYNMCYNISNRLVPNNGLFIQISLSQPHFRKKYLLGTHYSNLMRNNNDNNDYYDTKNDTYSPLFQWTFRYENVDSGNDNNSGGGGGGGAFGHFLYIMKANNEKKIEQQPKQEET